MVLEIAESTVEMNEDFVGTGDTEIDSNYYGLIDHVNVRNADKLVYGHIWAAGESFSGLKATADKIDYSVSDSAHSLRILQASNLNATAKMQSWQDEYNTTKYSLFTADGNGLVREQVQQPGKFNRPADLLDLWHNGTFRLNSSTRAEL